MIGAKKLTWKTSRQTCIGVSIEFMRLPPSSLGEIAALLTSASSALPSFISRWRISATAAPTSSGSERSTLMWSSGPDGHGQFSANGWREQVMTRQPSREKRLTVACPMPRLAPVRTIVFLRVSSAMFGSPASYVAEADHLGESGKTSVSEDDVHDRADPAAALRRWLDRTGGCGGDVPAIRRLAQHTLDVGQHPAVPAARQLCHRHALMRGGHEVVPRLRRQLATGQPFGWAAVIIAEPHAGRQVRGEADEPGVARILGRAGLAGGWPAEGGALGRTFRRSEERRG